MKINTRILKNIVITLVLLTIYNQVICSNLKEKTNLKQITDKNTTPPKTDDTDEGNRVPNFNIKTAMYVISRAYTQQFINSLVIIVLVNSSLARFQESKLEWLKQFPFFTGEFKDLNPEWFYMVGVTISFYMILNVFTPHIAVYIVFLIKIIQRCCDKCCSKNKLSSILTKEEYFDLYVGPEFSIGARYAQILTTIMVTMTLASGMPILYFCSFLFLLITYWIDKFMILRFYRTPPQMDLYISRMFTFYLYVGIMVHLCFGIWIYGNDLYFNSYESDIPFIQFFNKFLNHNISINSNTVFYQIYRRLIKPHNIIMSLFLISIILFLLFSTIILDIFSFLFCVKYWKCNCRNKQKFRKYEDLYESNFYFFIKYLRNTIEVFIFESHYPYVELYKIFIG